MKSKYYFLTSGLIAAGLAASAQASGYGEPVAGMSKMRGDCMTATGWHKMTGTVDKIDYAKGVLTLKSVASDMILHFPAASIKNLKNGDTITVDLGFSKEGAAPRHGY